MRLALALLIFCFSILSATTELYTLSLHDALPISPMVSVPWLFQVLPPTSTNEVGPGALSVLVAWVVKLPGPARAALEPVTVKSPVMVTAAVPPRVPPLPLVARLGRGRGVVVFSLSTPQLWSSVARG